MESSLRRLSTQLLWTMPILMVALLMLRASWDAQIERDASHFVFMAAHIAKGHASYWALWDTKNPLVELWWAGWIASLDGVVTWTQAARIGGAAWMLATAMAMASWGGGLLRERGANEGIARGLSALVACVWLVWILHCRDWNDALTLSMYHALPELGVLWLCLRLASISREPKSKEVARGALRCGVLLGLCVFACWFVKQTSLLVAIAIIFATIVLGVPMGQPLRRTRTALAAACVASAACLALFAWHLWATQTLAAYIDGTITYKSRMAGAYPWSAFWQGARRTLDLATWVRAPLLAIDTTTLLVGLLALPMVGHGAWQRVRMRMPLTHAQLRALLTWLWLILVLAQAIASLAFFRHYFLAALAPMLLCLVAGLAACRWSMGILGALAGWVFVVLAIPAWGDAVRLRARHEAQPIAMTVRELHTRIPRNAKVLNWSGLMHYFVEDERQSVYPRNVWWPAILAGVDAAQRDQVMREMLIADPPEYAIELFEQYPPEQGLMPVPLSSELLRIWTGRDYVLDFETPARPGRYGVPARVFRRVDGPTPTIPTP
jgi:hypothetical protein